MAWPADVSSVISALNTALTSMPTPAQWQALTVSQRTDAVTYKDQVLQLTTQLRQNMALLG